MKKIPKETISQGFGIGIGMAQTLYGNMPIPIIGGFIPPPWNQLNIFGNFIGGGIALGVLRFTKLIKNKNIKTVVKLYGMTAIIGGVLVAVSYLIPPAAALALRAPVQAPAKEFYHSNGYLSLAPDGYYTQQYYPGFQGSFWRRPQSMAKGWASDVTRNPMAAIPTRVPINTIIA